MTQIDTSKRVAIVTGCSEINSLGAAFSKELLKRGWTVFSTARKLSTLAPLQNLGCHGVELDVVSDASIAAAVKHITTLTGGRVDLLLNNVSHPQPQPCIRLQYLGRSYRICSAGPYRPCQARGDARSSRFGPATTLPGPVPILVPEERDEAEDCQYWECHLARYAVACCICFDQSEL